MPHRSLVHRVGNAMRLAEVLQVLAKHGFAEAMSRFGISRAVLRRFGVRGKHSAEQRHYGVRLRSALTELGPTFVKFGQILSTRPDLIGVELSNELSQLQDKVEPVPYAEIAAVVEETLGSKPDTLFAAFDREPIAAASLSQVYRARLHSGEEVAVKIQRPRARQQVESDLRLMHGLAQWLAEHTSDGEWLDPPGLVMEFQRTILRELDFNIERRTVERFGENFDGQSSVFVPAVYREYCSGKVLTMDWVGGVRVDQLDRYEERNSHPHTVALNGCRALCEQVFEHRLFHADPHPGNIFITKNNQISFLDYGMVGHLEQEDVQTMVDLLRAIFEQDAAACTQALLKFTAEGDMQEPDGLEHEVAEYIAFEAQAVIGGGEVGKALERSVTLLRRYERALAPRFSLLLKAMATIESTSRLIANDIDLAKVMRPYVQDAMHRRMSPGHVARAVQSDAAALLQLVHELPGDARKLMRMLRRGRFSVHLQHEKLQDLTQTTDRASNRITFGLIAGSLIVGSSLLISAGGTGTQTIGLVGYSIAGVLGLALLISILRSRNF
jgi:ubiquinone biosynthesis protein